MSERSGERIGLVRKTAMVVALSAAAAACNNSGECAAPTTTEAKVAVTDTVAPTTTIDQEAAHKKELADKKAKMDTYLNNATGNFTQKALEKAFFVKAEQAKTHDYIQYYTSIDENFDGNGYNRLSLTNYHSNQPVVDNASWNSSIMVEYEAANPQNVRSMYIDDQSTVYETDPISGAPLKDDKNNLIVDKSKSGGTMFAFHRYGDGWLISKDNNSPVFSTENPVSDTLLGTPEDAESLVTQAANLLQAKVGVE